jgi:hypothetical protein
VSILAPAIFFLFCALILRTSAASDGSNTACNFYRSVMAEIVSLPPYTSLSTTNLFLYHTFSFACFFAILCYIPGLLVGLFVQDDTNKISAHDWTQSLLHAE